jgi:hypothetical protein
MADQTALLSNQTALPYLKVFPFGCGRACELEHKNVKLLRNSHVSYVFPLEIRS